MAYSQLTQEQRYQIYEFKQEGKSQGEIARAIGVDRTTVCRELGRNAGERGYRPLQAHAKAMERRAVPRRPSALDPAMDKEIRADLRKEFSPDEIVGQRRILGKPTVGRSRIYQLVWADQREGGDLFKHLRRARKRRKRYGKPDRRGCIVGRVGIEHRPAVVQERSRKGDWEGDTVLGRQEGRAIVTLVERKSRFLVATTVRNRKAHTVGGAIAAVLEPHADLVHTITVDNGREFAGHDFFGDLLDASVYFARPYHSWERGLNENTNGLLRQYVPKGQSLKGLTEAKLQKYVARLNHRPRKCLGYRTPHEVFFGPSG